MDTNTGIDAHVLPFPLSARRSPAAIERHRFATAIVTARPGARERDVLETAWLRWLALLGEPGVWDDSEKRRALLRARLEYQDALLEAVAAAH